MRSTFLLLTASLALPSVALAQGAEPPPAEAPAAPPPEEEVSESDKARATKLFNEGRALVDAGDYAGACTKFEESQKVRPGIGTLFNLADCKEKLGFTATAYKLFVEVADRTKAALQADREEKARERVKGLEPRLMRLRLSIPKGGKVNSVKVDNVLVPEDDYNKALPYDPGEHTIEATTARDEGEPFTEEIELTEEGKTVTVAVPVAPGAKMKPRVGMIVGGGITMGVGALALIGAGALVATGAEEPGPIVGLGVLGIVGLAVGIPIFAVGFKKRPVREGYLDVPFEPSPIPTVAIGPTGGSLTWEF
jgi:hypothetical protein